MKKHFFYLFFLIIMVSCDYSTEPLTTVDTPHVYFTLPEDAYVQVVVQNIHGDIFRTLLSDILKVGTHKVSWDGKNEKGKYVKEGFYFISVIIYVKNSPITLSKLVYYGKD